MFITCKTCNHEHAPHAYADGGVPACQSDDGSFCHCANVPTKRVILDLAEARMIHALAQCRRLLELHFGLKEGDVYKNCSPEFREKLSTDCLKEALRITTEITGD